MNARRIDTRWKTRVILTSILLSGTTICASVLINAKYRVTDFVIEFVCRCYVQIGERGMSDHDETRARIQSLSDALLIQILQHHDFDDDITRMVEAEIARRRKEGGQQ
jgi:hypothetical protein